MTRRLVLATRNPHKVDELRDILRDADRGIQLHGIDEFDDVPEVVETGVTFEENALLKARATAEATGVDAIADDSGLCVDVLGGMPGVFSALWSGIHGDDQANLDLVLAQLRDVSAGHRRAHFACVAAFVATTGEEFVATGRLDGIVLDAQRGINGFGYDPIFLPDGFQQTTAEMTAQEKNAISHRGRAFRALAAKLLA